MRAWLMNIPLPTIPHTSQAATRLSKCCRLSYLRMKSSRDYLSAVWLWQHSTNSITTHALVQQAFSFFLSHLINQRSFLIEGEGAKNYVWLSLPERSEWRPVCPPLLTLFCWLILIFILPPCKQLSSYFHLFLLGHHDCEHLNIPSFDGHYTHDWTNFLSGISNIISGY